MSPPLWPVEALLVVTTVAREDSASMVKAQREQRAAQRGIEGVEAGPDHKEAPFLRRNGLLCLREVAMPGRKPLCLE
ncbi:MAG: hypothetical protein IPM88_20525 [Nitrospira sp.]|nr:hypothetical protein [Nitrospira sp.]